MLEDRNMTENWCSVPTLRGNHVILRPMVESDRDGLLAAAADTADWDDFYISPPTHDSFREWIGNASAGGSPRSMPFTACRPDNGKVIGTTHYLRMNERHRRLEIGSTFFARSVRRSGVNTESKSLLLNYAFDVLQCNVVQIRTDVLHHRSRLAIERLGARCDAILRRHSIMPNGRVRDLFVYSIIADEWAGVKQHIDHLLGHPRGRSQAGPHVLHTEVT